MMGVALGDHDGRYDYSEEWLTIVKRIWSEDKPFDFDGRHYKLKAVMAKPKPWWGSRPILVSAGIRRPQRFRRAQRDCLFTTVPRKHEELQSKLKAFRDAAPPDSCATSSQAVT
jgi:alkanesulfonate monooxygenase SsuD/methylene tetrahydromethanopterin reductase-like flavin-dependent oxidoreductase (luciferase family)